MEQSNYEYNNPYKYNGKELDEATGLYYYGARYYDPKASVWLSVDPLAVYNPVMETEFYGDGQHNGGVFYSGNLNPYIYTYQNPIIYIDPNGKQTESYATKRHDDNDMSQVVTIRGGRYYQNTTNTWAAFKNNVNSWLGGDDDYWVEKKPYDGADNKFIHNYVNAAAAEVTGIYAFKFLGKAFTISNKQIEGKLMNYLLNKSHPVGGSKAEWFEQALGFNQSNMKDLAKQIKFDPKKAVFQKNNGFGDLYQTVNKIKGANGKSVNVRFNWILKEGQKKAELVGALPTKK